jgi:hypothetical protein
MVAPARTPLRPDRLRALNLPSLVEVSLDTWGRPTWVRERDDVPTAEAAGAAEAAAISPATPAAGEVGGRGRAAVGDAVRGGWAAAGRRVEEVVEEWRIDDEWWRTPIHRRYVEVVLEGGAHVVLFEDVVTGEWYLQKP